MQKYHNFIGIDIGKFNFFVNVHSQKNFHEYENTTEGIAQFIIEHKNILSNTLCILETTGGHELELLYTLCQHNFPVHRADTRKVKNFIKSFGNAAKTDVLDAKALAKYGKERADLIDLFVPQSKQAITLFQLVQRRTDLTKMIAAEKNRRKSPSSQTVHKSYETVMKVLDSEIKLITAQIKELVISDPVLKDKHKTLKTIPGIGDVVAFNLLTLLPELGKLSRKKIASLTGLAPRANDSGRFQGYRRTGHGRSGIKPMLFVAAMAARNSKSNLKDFYENLIARGKKKMVALTALMRKIITIANARLKVFA
jgi:transposase